MKKTKLFSRLGASLLALAIWQICAMTIHQKILLVGPIDVLKRLTTIWREPGFAASIWFSFWHIAGGFFLAAILGIILGLLAGRYSIIETLLWPWMACMKAVPVASLVVICLIWLSSQNLSVFISFLIVLPLVYQNVLSGYHAQDQKLLEMAQVYRITPRKKLWYITFPQIKSYLLAALSTGAGMAWKAGVAAEVIGTPADSIGQKLFLSKLYLDTDDLLAWTVILVLLSILFEKLLICILKKVLK